MAVAGTSWKRVRAVFEHALERPSGAREEFLGEACGDDGVLREKVDDLLAAHLRTDTFLDPLDFDGPRETPAPTASSPGTRVGAYEIVRPLAAGGMGTVYEAVQDQPHRTVALKMLTVRLPSDHALRRFRYESEILAHLRHPGIAQVYEAGLYEEGEGPLRREVPWFAMELVEGARSLCRYAREEGLGVRAKLKLFARVCDAVHHGHQKGVIHRDLKPGNILVDGTGRPKVIDFGVARATDSDLTLSMSASLSSEFSGTLQYMSPEQLDGNTHDLDVRSDVYSLGVVLYELLTGDLPYDVAGKAMPDVGRAIREEIPRRPGLIDSHLAGDIEWIVMRCLAKEPARRYDSAAGLRDDIHHFLVHQSIEARPPTMSYRVRMFTRRHRALVAASGIVIAVLAAALTVVSIYAYRADREARRFAAADRFFQQLLGSSAHLETGEELRVADLLDEAAATVGVEYADDPEVEHVLRHTLGTSYSGMGRFDDAVEQLRRSVFLSEELYGAASYQSLSARADLGIALSQAGEYEEAEALLTQVLDAGADTAPEAHNWWWSLRQLARLRLSQGRAAEAEELSARCLLVYENTLGHDHPLTLVTRSDHASALALIGKREEAERELREALAALTTAGQEHPVSLSVRRNLADRLTASGAGREAEELMHANVTAAVRMLGPYHPESIATRHNLGTFLLRRGRLAEAEELLSDAAEQFTAGVGAEHPMALTATANLGVALFRQGRAEAAEPILERALEGRRQRLGAEHRDTLSTMRTLGELRLAKGEPEGLAMLERAHEAQVKALGQPDPETLETAGRLAWAYAIMGRGDRAERLLREALDSAMSALGGAAPEVISLRNDLAGVVFDGGDSTGAVALLREGLATLTDVGDRRSPNALVLAANLGNLLAKSGDAAEGEALLLGVLDTQLEVLGDHHEDIRVTCGSLARLYEEKGRHGEAEAYYRDWLQQHRALFGPTHVRTLSEVTALGLALSRWGRRADAETLFREAFEGARVALPGVQIEAYCAANLGECLVALDRRAEAVVVLEGWRDRLHSAHGADDERTLAADAVLARIRDA